MEDGAYVSSYELTNLRDKILKLSKTLDECYETITRQTNTLGNTWRDSKYELFVEDFRASKEKIRSISEDYEKWAKGYLTKHIELCLIYEK
jgi:hypothetical protein